jgi:hypothetical protein
MTGDGNGVVLIVKWTGADSGLEFPVMSIWSAVTVCAPFASAVAGVQDQPPVGPTEALQIGDPLSRTVTFALGSPVPETVGVAVTKTEPSAGDDTTGANGCPVTMVNETVADGGLVSPAAFACVAVTVWSPSGDGATG